MPLLKQISLILIFACFISRLSAQVAIDSPANRVIYSGITNKFRISVKNKSEKSYNATVSTGSIAASAGNRYAWTICNNRDTSGSEVFHSTQNPADSVSFAFIIRPLPDPGIMVSKSGVRIEPENFKTEGIPMTIENMLN
jgi:hypothetical protein